VQPAAAALIAETQLGGVLAVAAAMAAGSLVVGAKHVVDSTAVVVQSAIVFVVSPLPAAGATPSLWLAAAGVGS